MGTCVTPFGYLGAEGARFLATRTAATIKQGAAIAAFAANAADALKNYRKLSDVSSRGVTIEEQQFNHVKDVYWAQENNFLNEFTEPTPWETKAVLAKRYAGRMWAPIAGAYAKKFKELECNKLRYCGTAYKRALEEILVARSTAKANIESLADRIAFYEIEQIRETDFERRKQAIALRKGLMGQASQLMASAAQGLAGAGASAMNQANEALRAFSYFREEGNQAERNYEREQQRTMRVPVEDRSIYAAPEVLAARDGFSPGMSTSSYVPEFDMGAGGSAAPSSISVPEVSNSDLSVFNDWGAMHYSAVDSGNSSAGMNIGDGK